MIIKFKSLELSNFMSFEYAKIVLDNNGFVKVVGNNKNKLDNSKSNGSGKSAIWEALNWCLTGETLRGSKNVVRSWYEDGCFVTVNCLCDAVNYEITRSKNHKKLKTNLFIKKDGEDISGKGIRDTEVILHNTLPDLSSELINSIVILGQGLPMRFTNNTPSGRKEVLEKLSKSDFMIDDVKSRIDTRKEELNTKLSDLNSSLIKLDTKIEMYDSNIKENQKSLDELSSMSISDLTVLLNSFNDSIDEVEASKNDILKKYDNPSEEYLNKLLNELNGEKNEKFEKYTTKVNSINTEFSKHNEFIEKISGLKSDISYAEKEINKLKSIKDVCPTCGQKLPNVHKVDTSELEKSVENKKSELEKLIATYEELVNKRDFELLKEKENYNDSLSIITNKSNSIIADLSEISNLNNKITTIKADADSVQLKIDRYNSRLTELTEGIDNFKAEIEKLNFEKSNITSDLTDVNMRLSIQKQFETAIKRDFRGILLQNCISYIDKKAKEYCKKIFDTDLISFCLDGNNISISYNGKEYESMSGGEKQKIDLIIQFSIRSMLCKYLNFSCNLLVLDELTDNIDLAGCNKVMNFISDVASDVDSVFIISHHENLELPFDNILSIVKNEQGISSVI